MCANTQYTYQPIPNSVLHLGRQSLISGSNSTRRLCRANCTRVTRPSPLTRALNTHAAARIVMRSSIILVAMISCHVDAHRDPGQHTVRDVVRQLDVVDKRVVVGGGLLEHPAVFGWGGVGDRVGGVGVGGFDFLDEGVVKVELANVLGYAADVGSVGDYGHVALGDYVEVGDAICVVAREHCNGIVSNSSGLTSSHMY